VLLIDGLFQVELGSRISLEELPFDASYYLGVRVDDDSEMTPRQPLTSVLYALRAEEANRLQGFEPRDLDQSDHLHDGTNPHGVTAAQAGADDGAELLAHTADGANPHAVTPEQLGAALAQDLEGHAAAADPHHARYSDVESVAAMGVKTTSNPLNHDRYTDARVLAVTGDRLVSRDDFELSSEIGALTLQTTSGGAQIELSAAGDITIRAAGDLSLEGGSVSITSQSTLKLEGSAGAELSTSAILDLKGSLININ